MSHVVKNCGRPLNAEIAPPADSQQENGTSVLQLQGTESCQQPVILEEHLEFQQERSPANILIATGETLHRGPT